MYLNFESICCYLILYFVSSCVRTSFCAKNNRFKLVFVDSKSPKVALVVGGVPVDIEQYPFVCILANLDSMCGGNILNSWTVLTAGHCFQENDNVKEMTIHAGSNSRHDNEAEVYPIDHLIVHPEFNKYLFSHDIALIFIDNDLPFNFGKKIKKAILPINDKWLYVDRNSTTFTVLGWGMVKYNGPMSALGLQMAQMKVVSMEDCAELHREKQYKFTPDQFCLYGDAERDTCKGDSGTGVYWKRQLVGLVSHGDGCAGKDKPSVYTNVFYFRDWIQVNIENYFEWFCANKEIYD